MPQSRLFYGYYLIAASFVAQFVSIGIVSYVAGSFMAPMSSELGWSRSEFTLARTVGQVVMSLTGFFIGTYVDRLGGRRLMLIGTLILSGALVLHSQLQTLWQWIFLNGVVTMIGCALIGSLVVNVTLAKWFVERRGQAVAWAAMGISMGGVVLTPLITWAIDSYGWRTAWLQLGIGALLIMLPVALAMRRAPEDYGLHPDGHTAATVAAGLDTRARADYDRSMTRSEAIRTPSFYALIVAFGFFQINILVVLLHAVPFLVDTGFSRSEAAFSLVVASIPAMLSKPVWGFFIDRLPAQPLAAVSASLTGLALVAIVFALQSGAQLSIYAAFALLGLGWGGMIPLQEVIWGAFFGRRYLGAVRSAALPVALLIAAAAPYLVALHRDHSGQYDPSMLAVAGLNILSGVLIYCVRPPSRIGTTA